jgi:hypothetical protein
MRVLVVMVSMGAALALIAASGLMNWVFMTSLGKSDFERQILGVVSVAVSAFIALLPTLMLWAWRERRLLYVLLGIPAFLVFGAFSLSSAVGFAAQNRGSISENRGLATSRLATLHKDIADAEAKKRSLGEARPVSVVQEAMRGLEQDRWWQWSRECQDAASPASRSFCKQYFDLKGEAARASEVSALEEKIERLKSEARHYEEKGAGRESDNQAAVLGRVLGLKATEVEEDLTLFLAVLVEMGAALGLYFATGHMRMSAASNNAVHSSQSVTLHQAPVAQSPAPKQLAKPGPKRVPRIKREQQVSEV